MVSLGNVGGLLMEPVNPSNSITKKVYMDDKTRQEILGSVNT